MNVSMSSWRKSSSETGYVRSEEGKGSRRRSTRRSTFSLRCTGSALSWCTAFSSTEGGEKRYRESHKCSASGDEYYPQRERECRNTPRSITYVLRWDELQLPDWFTTWCLGNSGESVSSLDHSEEWYKDWNNERTTSDVREDRNRNSLSYASARWYRGSSSDSDTERGDPVDLI